jgi:hypothetical protein
MLLEKKCGGISGEDKCFRFEDAALSIGCICD